MITKEQKVAQYGEILEELAKALDLTEKQVEEAEERYKAVGEYLQREGSTLAEFNPSIEPQGSFLYGTMTRPIHEDGQFDIDLICKLEDLPAADTQEELKNMVGDELKEGRYETLLDDEGRRCWTLNYAEGTKFHMDILPAIPDEYREQLFEGVVERDVYQYALRMTDRDHDYFESNNRSEWPKTNPKGYAGWFKDRMRPVYNRVRKKVAESFQMAIEEVPDWRVKTPLQRAIQILKRHRDLMFGEDENKPISIIITTLAARAYNQEENVYEALISILNGMEKFIEYRYRDGKRIAWIENPVNPEEENFADKWEDNDELEENFYGWLAKAKSDLLQSIQYGDVESAKSVLEASFGASYIKTAYKNVLGENFNEVQKPSGGRALPTVAHKEQPKWPVRNNHNVTITGRYKYNDKWIPISDDTVIPKHCPIMFAAHTDVSKPFEVFWQVVNTGEEARRNNGLRGTIFPSTTAGVGGLKQRESSLYKGTHWIECFIVQDRICVAKSGEFIVEIE